VEVKNMFEENEEWGEDEEWEEEEWEEEEW